MPNFSHLRFFLLGVLFLAGSQLTRAATVPVITIRDSINVGVAEHIKDSLEKAKATKAPALLIVLDTPGGFLEATRDIVKLMLNSEIPIGVWVAPEGARAASAGSMITMAAHYAAMAPSTSIGAATPVSGGGKEVGESMKKKITNDTLAFVEGIAKKRGRNVEWARKTVSEAATAEAEKALSLNAIDGVHSSLRQVWVAMAEKNPQLPKEADLVYWDFSLKTKVLSFFSDPNVAYGLMALGALGIYLEMTNPGTMIPGSIGALSLALGAISLKILPVQNGALILFLVGLILIAVEIFVPAATFGVAGAAGGASLLLSGVFLIDPEQSNLSINLSLWIPVFLVLGAFCAWIGIAAAKSLRSHSMPLGIDALIGNRAEVIKVLSKKRAQVRVHSEIWTVEWDSHFQHSQEFFIGQKLEVTKQEGSTAFVKEIL